MNAMKMKLYTLLLCLSAAGMSYSAMGMVPEDDEDYIIYSSADTPPSFLGAEGKSLQQFRDWIESRLTLNNVQESTRIVFSVIVEKDGRISSMKVIRDRTGNPAMLADLKRVLEKVPRWAPGIKYGQPQRVSIMLDVDFMRPDLLLQERKAAHERERQKLEAGTIEHLHKLLLSYGVNPETDIIDTPEQLQALLPSATKPTVVIFLGNLAGRPMQNMMEEWNQVLSQYSANDYRRYVVCSKPGSIEELKGYGRLLECYDMRMCPSILFFYDRQGNYGKYTEGYRKEEQFRSALRNWFGEMMRKADFR